MLSQSKAKYIRSLAQQKYRYEHNAYIAEGDKLAKEWLNSTEQVRIVAALPAWLEANRHIIAPHPEAEVIVLTETELQRLSLLQTPNQVLVVASMPAESAEPAVNEWCLGLDQIQDPGNMGTIIRIADWFGIRHIACSENCVDLYNPKVVQSAMGGHLRVSVTKTDLPSFIRKHRMPVYAATLQGRNVDELEHILPGMILIGNESKGLREDLVDSAAVCVTIPRKGGAESLNAAVSAGILCALMIR